MSAGKAERIEGWIDRSAAAIFAAAVAVSAVKLVAPVGQALGALVIGAGAAGYWVCVRALRAVRAEEPRFLMADFAMAEIEAAEADELLLTEQVELLLMDADRFNPIQAHDELLLDDILAEIGSDSRVVRLFDPAAMPTPAQLNARIERHLNGANGPAAQPDASQALYDALADLRRSLR